MEQNEDDDQDCSENEGYTPFVIDTRVIKNSNPRKRAPYEQRDVQYKRFSSKPDFDPRRLFGRQFDNSLSRSYGYQPYKQIYTNSGGGDVQNSSGGFRNQRSQDRLRYSYSEDFNYTRFPTPEDNVPKEPPRYTQVNEYKQFPPLRDPRSRFFSGNKPDYKSCSGKLDDSKVVGDNKPEPRGNVSRVIPSGDPRAIIGSNRPQSGPTGGYPRSYTSFGNKQFGDPRPIIGGNKGDPYAVGTKPQDDLRAVGTKLQGDARVVGTRPLGDPQAAGTKPQGDLLAVGTRPLGDPRAVGTKSLGDPRAVATKPQGDPRAVVKKPQVDLQAVGTKPQFNIGDPQAPGGNKPCEPRSFGNKKGDPRPGGKKGEPQKPPASKAYLELKAKILAGTKLHKSLNEKEKKMLIEDLANDLQRMMREAREAAPADSACTACTARRTCSEPQMPTAIPEALPFPTPEEPAFNELVVVKTLPRESSRRPRISSSESTLEDLRSIWQSMPSTSHAKPPREQCHVLFDPEFEKWKDPPPEEHSFPQPAPRNQKPPYWVDFDIKKEIGQPILVYNTKDLHNRSEMKPKWVHPDFKFEEAVSKKEQEDKSEQHGAKKKHPHPTPTLSPSPVTPPLPPSTITVYTVQSTVAPLVSPVCPLHSHTSAHKVVHTTTVAYVASHSPDVYTHSQSPGYPTSSGYTPVYPHPYPYYPPGYYSSPEHVYGAYQHVSQSHHYFPQGYTEHHYVSQQYRANQGWYYPSQRYPVYMYPNIYTQYTRSERVYIQSNQSNSDQTNSGNYYMMRCPLQNENEEPSVTITEVEDDKVEDDNVEDEVEDDNVEDEVEDDNVEDDQVEDSDNTSQGSSSIIVEDEKEQSISQDEMDTGSQTSSDSNSSGYTEFQVLYEADNDAIKLEDLNEREWQPFILPEIGDQNTSQNISAVQKSPAVSNIRELYTIQEENEARSARGSQRCDSPRIGRQDVSTSPKTNVVVTTAQSFMPYYPQYR